MLQSVQADRDGWTERMNWLNPTALVRAFIVAFAALAHAEDAWGRRDRRGNPVFAATRRAALLRRAPVLRHARTFCAPAGATELRGHTRVSAHATNAQGETGGRSSRRC